MPQMAPAYGAHTLGDLEARTAYNQITFLPIELNAAEGMEIWISGRG